MDLNVFSYSRFALQYGLHELGFKPEDSVLVPDYNCDVIYYPLRQLGFKLQFYSLNYDFTPVWESIYKAIDNSTRALMMVHYFGQPQPINKFMELIKKYNLLLIEDNAHGHSGTYNGKKLGTYGDIGFSSPRKQLNLAFGGSLYIRGKEIGSCDTPIFSMNKKTIKMELLKSLPKLSVLRQLFKKHLVTKPNFTDPNYFSEGETEDVLSDLFTANRIRNADWKLIGQQRRETWLKWVELCKKINLTPIWDYPDSGSCPWIMPAYVENENYRKKILESAWKTGLDIISWPSLPNSVLKSNLNQQAVNRWNKLVFFSLNKSPEMMKKEIEIFKNLILA